MEKSREAFRTISEVSELLDTPAHVLRFWESRFPQVRPVKRAGGRRYYRPTDVALLYGIKRLLHSEGLTIRGVQKVLREQGIRHVMALADGALNLPFATETAEAAEPPVADVLVLATRAEAAPRPAPEPAEPALPLWSQAEGAAPPAPPAEAEPEAESEAPPDVWIPTLLRRAAADGRALDTAALGALAARLERLRARLGGGGSDAPR